MKILVYILPYFLALNLTAQTLGEVFEMRHFTSDPKANGETDFKGETAWMNTEQRVRFLNDYADHASRYFGNPEYDQEIVNEDEVEKVLASLKAPPLTNIRRTIPLNGWKAYGYKKGQDIVKQEALNEWQSYDGASITNGKLLLDNANIERKTDSLFWRFKFRVKINSTGRETCTLALGDGNKKAIALYLKNGELSTVSAGKVIRTGIKTGNQLELEIEGDFTQKRFNLIVNGKQLQNYIPMADTSLAAITKLILDSKGKITIDELFIFNHIPGGPKYKPYYSTVVLDEDFEEKPPVHGWQTRSFDDQGWKEVDLPAAHGGIREKEEDFYLRKKITVGEFERATLVLETLDPGGEVWINNQVAAVVTNRHPVAVDVTGYLKPNSENLIAVRVKSYKITDPMGHTPSDHYIGWFLGRTSLLLSSKCMIKQALVHTASLGNPAVQSHKVRIQHPGKNYWQGSLEINYYPWFPVEGSKEGTYYQNIQIRPGIENEFDIQVPVYSPRLWSADTPELYKVEILLKDNDGHTIDDYVVTTGIRTVEQKHGDFYFNGKPEMLNGAQIMGFRMPIETISKNSRCATPETVAEELLMIKKMNGNLLRMHVHAQNDTADGINDPRYAEWADQLGVSLIWQTAGWVRNGEAWNIDFKGFPKYMEQVYNHPSIVMWEASNHPNKFKEHAISDTHDFVKKTYDAIYPTDQSRIISLTSFWQHVHYANYQGTIDYKGNKIQAVPEFTAKRVTRGSQDAYTGYGHEWSEIRKAPNQWAASCLAAKEKAYFNFEHEESIGQPNWNLCKGKPWYLLQSYEWEYDTGSIGRKLSTDEWKASQAWQAFSAWESMKKQILLGYDGFSWCCLHGGANMGTYKKPLIDNLNHPKLAFYTNKMVFQKTWAASNNVDVVYGPDDQIKPVINHLGDHKKVDLIIQLQSIKGKVMDKRVFRNIELPGGHSIIELKSFRFHAVKDGTYFIHYKVIEPS